MGKGSSRDTNGSSSSNSRAPLYLSRSSTQAAETEARSAPPGALKPTSQAAPSQPRHMQPQPGPASQSAQPALPSAKESAAQRMDQQHPAALSRPQSSQGPASYRPGQSKGKVEDTSRSWQARGKEPELSSASARRARSRSRSPVRGMDRSRSDRGGNGRHRNGDREADRDRERERERDRNRERDRERERERGYLERPRPGDRGSWQRSKDRDGERQARDRDCDRDHDRDRDRGRDRDQGRKRDAGRRIPAALLLMSSEQRTPLLHSSPSGAQAADGSIGPKPAVKPITLWPLVVLIFFEVSGGPFGTEDAVSAAGPLLTVLGFIILPLVWSVPEALVTAELSTAFPENSGYVAWVTAAFGPYWGFLEGLWSWLSGVTDNSLYPVMLAANLQLFFPVLGEEGPTRSIFVVGLCLALSYFNYRGLTVVGHSLVASALAVLLPFVLMSALAIPKVRPANWTVVDWDTVNWGTFINVMFWNLNYWDSVSTLAGEVSNPSKTFPRAMLLAVLLVVVMYLVPALTALGVAEPGASGDDWGLGYYAKVAKDLGGSWLAVWVLFAAAFSQVGQYQAEMASDSYQLQGMAERGFLPLVLARRSPHGTPTLGIILSSAGVLVLSCLSFVEIVELLNAIYCLAELLEFAAFIWLRIAQPDLPRPYRVPLPTWGCILMLLPASLLLMFVLVLPFANRSWTTVGATVGAIVLGIVLYPLLQVARRRGWCEFSDFHFDADHVYGPRVPCSASWWVAGRVRPTPPQLY
ncbi:hypothetical protein QJQ45_013786 [Haematococcus lacustris]|nr:hypothetical protein QJQ45_013786 [Haematococcus lacustris]